MELSIKMKDTTNPVKRNKRSLPAIMMTKIMHPVKMAKPFDTVLTVLLIIEKLSVG